MSWSAAQSPSSAAVSQILPGYMRDAIHRRSHSTTSNVEEASLLASIRPTTPSLRDSPVHDTAEVDLPEALAASVDHLLMQRTPAGKQIAPSYFRPSSRGRSVSPSASLGPHLQLSLKRRKVALASRLSNVLPANASVYTADEPDDRLTGERPHLARRVAEALGLIDQGMQDEIQKVERRDRMGAAYGEGRGRFGVGAAAGKTAKKLPIIKKGGAIRNSTSMF